MTPWVFHQIWIYLVAWGVCGFVLGFVAAFFVYHFFVDR